MSDDTRNEPDSLSVSRQSVGSSFGTPPVNQRPVYRRTPSTQRIFIDIPADNTQVDGAKQIFFRKSKPISDDSYRSAPNGEANAQPLIIFPEHSQSDRELSRVKSPSSPRREKRNIDRSLQEGANSYLEEFKLLRDERDMFRNCALGLLEILDKNSAPVRLEKGTEVLKCGILLKKASNNIFRIWREKYVVVTIGKLLWYPLPSSQLQDCEILVTNKMRRHQREMILDENTEPRCSLSGNASDNHEFDVIYKKVPETALDLNSVDALRRYIQSASSSAPNPSPPQPPPDNEETIEKHFRCKSDEERDSWLRALRQARLRRYNDPSMWFSQHVFTAVRDLVSRATTIEEVVMILGTIDSIPLRIPVFFIQSISQGYRGPSSDPQLAQVIRDLNRETVVLNEMTFQASLGDSDSDGFASKVVFLLVESLRRRDPQMVEWDALRFARKVLLHTYRSQTGGDCFDALNELLGQSAMVSITPQQVAASKNPIRIEVTDTIPNVNDSVNKEGPYVTSYVNSFFTIGDRAHRKTFFNVKATVKSVIGKESRDIPWTLELEFTSCYACLFPL